ncbi:MAG: hypothetical protein K2X49_19740 [Acetobacteraceae bacterium]|nr:hypothetical protein [Acetobacteraceae bacterium]
MTTFRLTQTDVVAIGPDIFRFAGRTRDERRLIRWQNMKTDAERHLRDDEFGLLLESPNGARFLGPTEVDAFLKGEPAVPGAPIMHIEDIRSDWERERVTRLIRYCEGWKARGSPSLSDEPLQAIIDEVANNEGYAEKPSPRTLRKFIPLWRAHGLAALISGASRRGRRTELSPELLEIVEDAIWNHYLTPRKPTVAMTLEVIKGEISKQEEKQAPGTPKLGEVSKRQLEARINRIDSFTKMALREGQRAALLKFGPRYAGVVTSRPNQRWELDGSQADVFAICPETGEVIGRPTIVVAIDCHTRMIVGWYIGFADESLITALIAVRMGIESKASLKERFPELVHALEAQGMPEEIAVDNHLAYGGDGFKRACTAARIELRYTPVLKPWFRPIIERFFRTAKERTFQRMPGGVPSNLLRRDKENPPEDAAVATLEQIESAFAKWVVDDYAYEIHRGLNTCPAHAWRRDVAIHGVVPPLGKEALDTALAVIDERTLWHYGIEWEGLIFNSPVVAAAAIAPGAPKRHRIAVNPLDLTGIMLFVPSAGRWLRVDLIKPVLAAGTALTYDAYCLTKRLLKEQAERFLLENDTSKGFRRAHDHVLRWFAAPPKGKTVRERKEKARWLVTDVRKPRAAADLEDKEISAMMPSDELFSGDAAQLPEVGMPTWVEASPSPPPPPFPTTQTAEASAETIPTPDPDPAQPEGQTQSAPKDTQLPGAVFISGDGKVDLDAAAKALGMDEDL